MTKRHTPVTERLTQLQLATYLDLTDRQIRNLAKKGLPRDADGRYPYPAAFHWYVAHKLEAERAKLDAGGSRLLNAEIRDAEAKAALREHALRLAERTVIRLGFANDVLAEYMSIFRSSIESMEGRLAAVMAGASTPTEVRQRARPIIDAVLQANYEATMHAIAQFRDDGGEDEEGELNAEEVDEIVEPDQRA